MVRRRNQARPVEWLSSGEWPSGGLKPEAPPEAVAAKAISLNLEAALEGRSPRGLAAEANLAHTTIYDLLSGKSYGDVITVSRLEAALDRNLWPVQE